MNCHCLNEKLGFWRILQVIKIVVKPVPAFVDSADNTRFKENVMTMSMERRTETRLRYNWPVWFAENFDEILTQGQMTDISSDGAAFTCYADKCPYPGQSLTARFSVPRYGEGESFNMANFIRAGHVCHVEQVTPYVRRVAMQFAQPLPFKPGNQQDAEKEATEALAGVLA
jgi:hypothetical protein